MSAFTKARPIQGVIRLLGVAALVAVVLFPPWQLEFEFQDRKEVRSAGYRPLWSPPQEEVDVPDEAVAAGYRMNVVRLGIQLGLVLIVMNGAIYAVRLFKK